MTEAQKKKLDEVTEAIRIRMTEPYHDHLLDLVLYKVQHARGVRISDIDKLIAAELNRLLPKAPP